MSKKLLIGISGKMGSGKTTLSDGIISQLGGTRVSLAAPIKHLQNLVYENVSIEMEGEKDRDLCIALGLWGRSKHPNFWLNELEQIIDASDAEIIICDDVRFVNEAEYFKKNGILMRIHGEQRGENVDHNINNVSETALDGYNFDYYIDNRRSVSLSLADALQCVGRKQ